MLNAIKNIGPNVVFIEARKDSFVDYGVADGGKKSRIPHKSRLFKGTRQDFTYPTQICDIWENIVNFIVIRFRSWYKLMIR